LNSGAIIADSTGQPSFFNTSGCIALADKTNGPACAQALEPLVQCEFGACNSTACQNAAAPDVQACIMAADMGACSSQYSAALSACQMDFADGGAGAGVCSTNLGTINEICGTGM
jgi:hypothetical protein